jgi:hypothetical protein
MALRAILLVTLAALLSTGIIRGDDDSKLPSRNVRVVMPLLRQFSPKDTSRTETMNQLGKILGEADGGEMSGPKSTSVPAYANFHFKLDDGTHVDVSFAGEKLVSITAHLSDQSDTVIYPKPSH